VVANTSIVSARSEETAVTQPIPPDRLAPPIADRDRPKAARPPATATGPSENAAAKAADTADVSQGSALLRSTAPAPASGNVANAEQARALAARITEALSGDPARAMQAYAAIRREDAQALLATA
jgi:hypothetical protein